MHSKLPCAQSDESNMGDDEPFRSRIPPVPEDLSTVIDFESNDRNALVPSWLKNLTEEEKAERAKAEDLMRQKKKVRRRVVPTFEIHQPGMEYKPRYNKYRCGRSSSFGFIGSPR